MYDNGPYFNSPGGGPGGADGQCITGTLIRNEYTWCWTCSFCTYRVADDFIIPGGETWTINTVSFYAYQTGSTTTQLTSVNVRIWDGPPGEVGSSVVFGDTTTNRMASTSFTNCYRYSETAVGTTRPIMKLDIYNWSIL